MAFLANWRCTDELNHRGKTFFFCCSFHIKVNENQQWPYHVLLLLKKNVPSLSVSFLSKNSYCESFFLLKTVNIYHNKMC